MREQGPSNFSPHKWAAITKETEVGLIPIHVTQIILATNKKNRSLWTETTDFWVPHCLAVPQRYRACNGKAEKYHI
jgi:hypothetical protein